MAKKEELIEDYIGQTFPFIIQEALEQQEARVQMSVQSGAEKEVQEREKKILETMLSENFKHSLLKSYRDGLQVFSQGDIEFALAFRSFERKSDELSRKVGEDFRKLLNF